MKGPDVETAEEQQHYNSSDKTIKRHETYSANWWPCGDIARVDRWKKTGGQPRRVGDGLRRPDFNASVAFQLINKNQKRQGLQGEHWSGREEEFLSFTGQGPS
jgi:hypothetical protein